MPNVEVQILTSGTVAAKFLPNTFDAGDTNRRPVMGIKPIGTTWGRNDFGGHTPFLIIEMVLTVEEQNDLKGLRKAFDAANLTPSGLLNTNLLDWKTPQEE